MFNKLDKCIAELSNRNKALPAMTPDEIIDMLLDVRSDMELGLIIDGDEMTKYFSRKR